MRDNVLATGPGLNAVEACETMTYLSTPPIDGGSLSVSAISVQAVGDAGYADSDVFTNCPDACW